MKTRSMLTAAVLVGALASPALAQTDTLSLRPTGIGMQLGGGVTGFARKDARDAFRTGGYWDLRAVLGSRSLLGADYAYIASSHNASTTGLVGDAQLLGDGAEAVARANLPLRVDHLRVTPFLFGGAGWTYYQVVGARSNVSGIKQHASALVLPFGAGMSGVYEHVMVDARFTYRGVFDSRLVSTESGHHASLQSWSLGFTVGYEI